MEEFVLLVADALGANADVNSVLPRRKFSSTAHVFKLIRPPSEAASMRDYEARLDVSEAMIHIASAASCSGASPMNNNSQTDLYGA